MSRYGVRRCLSHSFFNFSHDLRRVAWCPNPISSSHLALFVHLDIQHANRVKHRREAAFENSLTIEFVKVLGCIDPIFVGGARIGCWQLRLGRWCWLNHRRGRFDGCGRWLERCWRRWWRRWCTASRQPDRCEANQNTGPVANFWQDKLLVSALRVKWGHVE